VWVANGRDGRVSRIDPKTARRSPARSGGVRTQGIALYGDDLWVANQLSTGLTRVNRSTGLARSIVGDGPGTVVVAGGALWVSEEFQGRPDPDRSSDPSGPKVGDRRLPPRARGGRRPGLGGLGAFADPKHRGVTRCRAAGLDRDRRDDHRRGPDRAHGQHDRLYVRLIRVGNYQSNQIVAALLSQLWVQ